MYNGEENNDINMRDKDEDKEREREEEKIHPVDPWLLS